MTHRHVVFGFFDIVFSITTLFIVYNYLGNSMTGQRIGYIRVSTFDQNPERQLEGVKVDRAFSDKASGKDVKRPQLEALISFARTGDTVVVHSMDRLARNLDDLRRIVQTLTQRGVHIEFVKEHLSFTGEDSPMANLMLSVMGAFAEFERALIRERQREVLRSPSNAGLTVAGRNPCRLSVLPNCANVSRLASKRPSLLVNSESVAKPCINT